MQRRTLCRATILACLPGAAAAGGSPWINFTNETATRLVADPAVGALDVDEKDYAWDDVDHDGDTDLVVVRKQPFSSVGGRRNVLLLNEGGVLTDRTAQYIPGFLDLTNDRDVRVVDVNNDTWPDIVTAATCHGCDSSAITDDSRLYLNLGAPGGSWLGYGAPTVLFAGGHNFSAVAAGDVTGDGYADLYFVSYQDTAEDQLMINGGAGDPGVFTIENGRLTAAMRNSSFGTNGAIADMNGDGWADIVKSEAGPVEIFRNAGNGTFDLLDPTYNGAAYHVGVGDLDGNGLLDLVISDDGNDRYIINNGNIINGSPDSTLAFPASTNGFNANSIVVDLDNDRRNDVLIADVDVDLPGCTRTAEVLRNNGGTPPAFTNDPGTIPPAMLTGVFDMAAFDINGDATLDLVVGRCNGTQVWIAAPFVTVEFSYPAGLPPVVEPQAAASFPVQLTPINSTIEPDTPALHASINGGPFITTSLAPAGGDLYLATLPAVECTDRVEFYLTAQTSGGQDFADPPAAPVDTYLAIGAAGTEILLADHFEGDVSDWTVVSDPSLVTGEWEQAVPDSTLFAGQTAAPGEDATPAGDMAFVTENGPPGSIPQAYDVDFGPTYLISPVFDLQDSDAIVTAARWAFSTVGIHDPLITELSSDGGSTWTLVDSTENTGSAWQTASFIVSDFAAPTAQMRVRFGICDCPNDSVTEAGIDDFRIDKITCVPPCPWDLDGTGDVNIIDFLGLLAAWGSDPGAAPDFDGDGVVDITDFLALLANWGPCP